MDNKQVVKKLRTLSALMELHGENEFKVRGYGNAIYNIERHPDPLKALSLNELEAISGIGKSIAAKIHELLTTGNIKVLEDLMEKTPEGLHEVMEIKGLGAKKVRSLWLELDVTTLSDLQNVMNDGSISRLKGFGGKVLEGIKESISFYTANKSRVHLSTGVNITKYIEEELVKVFGDLVAITGQVRRSCEVIDNIELIVGTDQRDSAERIDKIEGLVRNENASSPFAWRGLRKGEFVPVTIHISHPDEFCRDLFLTTGSAHHLSYVLNDSNLLKVLLDDDELPKEEAEVYERLNVPFIIPEMREGLNELHAENNHGSASKSIIQSSDLKGILHCHSTYSDGLHSLREMAESCKSRGYEYLGISDHSKAAAFYANGLDEDRVYQQQEEIDKLNKELAPFRVFKGIEADILPEGELDYDPETLQSFDFVVASIHSVLSMDLEKSMNRLLSAIRNPHTTIMGHLTGRQLLIRDGYPVDHKVIIDACAEHEVVIEVNSHPNRLDLDWRWIPYAVEKGVMLSINPDAHSKEHYSHMDYGVMVSRKAGLTADSCLNTLSLTEIEMYFEKRKKQFTTNQ